MTQKKRQGGKPLALAALAMMAAGVASAVADESGIRHGGWRFGIGTGVFGLNVDGDVGIGTRLLGPTRIRVDLNTDDVKELTDSAFGLAGFASHGSWIIQYRGGRLKLADVNNGTTPAGVPVSIRLDFKVITGELTVGYRFPAMGRHQWAILGGASWTSHDYDARLIAGATDADRTIDNDWTDGLVGLNYSFAIAERLYWANEVDARYGGSNGSWHARSAINRTLGGSRPWVLSFYADFRRINYEHGSESRADWYLYKAREFGPGFGFMYVF